MERLYSIRFYWCLLFIGLINTSLAQNNTISGKVINKETKAPVAGASVFISGTSRGTISNNEGEFTLLNIPNGKFDLVVTNVSFQSYVRPFNVTELPLTLNIELDLKVTELEQVIIRPYEEDTWAKWGLFFTETFIGTSLYSKQTVIKNKESIKFRYYRKEQILEAFSEGPIIIENRALGYTIQYQLEHFQYSTKERKLLYYGFTLFEDMADDRRRVPRRWAYNRTAVYEGSMVHFFKSLYDRKSEQNGYEVRILKKGKNIERERVAAIYQEIKANIDSFGLVNVEVDNDSLNYYSGIMRQSEYVDYLQKDPINPENFIIDHTLSEKELFFNDYLHIRYKKKLEDIEFIHHTRENRKAFNPTSVIFLDEKTPVSVNRHGNFYPPQNVVCSGYWAWSEKVATLLPLDYDPDEFMKVKNPGK
ncbi:carboxypeptidase-like regulatory domain-containing protein [Gynurincola endophyticus]|uniref:carboxypeptidase-like regulatory domain-containing protein n=1 Tax=Gynurincola endophyticus TaxID=2479004 RepID=UPI00131523D7|nr:carboxypeptidase-like regulatory domain-containing protein [Gynurincola endophyticus]